MNNDKEIEQKLGIKFDPKNPRLIQKHDFEALKKSIKTFGDLSCIVENVTTGELVGGHQRVRGLMAIGEAQIFIDQEFEQPTSVGTVAVGHVQIGGSDEQFKFRRVKWSVEFQHAANIAANRISGEFNIDQLAELTYELSQFDPDLALLTGQTQKEIDRLLDLVGAKGESEDEAPAVDDTNPPASELGKVYQLGRHKLMCGDATSLDDVQQLMGGKQADLVWTDPPYNVTYEGKTDEKLTIKNDSFKDSAAFYDFLFLAFGNLNAITKSGSPIYICHADMEGLNFRKAMVEAGWSLRSVIIWNKNTMVLGRGDYQWKHEPILYGWKEGAAHFFVEDRNLTTVWDFDKPSTSSEHPTMKPIALVKHALTNSSRREAIVVDTFGGSGSTLMAAEESDRTCYTMELDPKYCDVIRKRYAISQNREADWDVFTPELGTEAAPAPIAPPAGEPPRLEDIKVA